MLSGGERNYLRTYMHRKKRLKELEKFQRPLTKTESEELQKLKRPKTANERNFRSNIRKKIRQSMQDVTLVFESLPLNELGFNEKDYFDYVIPLVKVTTNSKLQWSRSGIKRAYFMADLIRAKRDFDYKRLVTDKNYLEGQVRWLVKNGFCNPLTLEEQDKLLKEIRDVVTKSNEKSEEKK